MKRLANKRTILLSSLASLICLGDSFVPSSIGAQADLTLSNGWNLVSLPLQPNDTNILSLLAPIQGDYQSVWTYSNGHWYGFNPDIPGLADLGYIQAGKAYWIQMRRDRVLTIDGVPALNGPNDFGGQNLRPGWNLLGYSSGWSQNVNDAFAPIAGHLDLVAADPSAGWRWYKPGKPAASTLGSLQPFKGVWAHVSTNQNWTAPNFRGTLVNATTGKPVVGAIVALDGIEAEAPTDAQGSYLISGLSDDTAQTLTVVKKGYVPLVKAMNLATTNAATVPLTPLPSPLVGEVLVPQNNSVWVPR